jgi:Mg-chelatase subunit ChlD
VVVTLTLVSGCGARSQRGQQALFAFDPVESPNPATPSGHVRRKEDGPDRYSYRVPARRVLWVTEGTQYSRHGVDYANPYQGSGYHEVRSEFENEYPSRYYLQKSNDPVFHDGGELLGVDIQSAERVISPDGETVDVRVRITAPSSKSAQRAGNNFAIVLDASESMREPEKLELLKLAGHYLVDQIFPGDRAGLIVLGEESSMLLHTTDNMRPSTLHQIIDSLVPAGRGMLAMGLDQAYAQMEAIVQEAGAAGHVVLVTDGQSGRGKTGAWRFVSMALRRQAQKGVRLSVVGVGHQMDAKFLSELARAGDGRFAYLQNSREVDSVLGRELETMLHVYARNVRLRITNPEGGQVLSIHGLEFPTPRNGVDEISLSDFVPGEQRSLLLRIQYPPSAKSAHLYSTNFRLFYERVAPLRRNAIDRGIVLRTGARTTVGPANPSVDVYSRLVLGMETVRMALDSGSEASAKVVKGMLEKEYPKLHETALKSADRDLVHHAELFSYFANRLNQLVVNGKLQGVSAERDSLRKELYYRRYPVKST